MDQQELAWVSTNESASVKRLSWLTVSVIPFNIRVLLTFNWTVRFPAADVCLGNVPQPLLRSKVLSNFPVRVSLG